VKVEVDPLGFEPDEIRFEEFKNHAFQLSDELNYNEYLDTRIGRSKENNNNNKDNKDKIELRIIGLPRIEIYIKS
jgi:hypothetical protein